MTLLDLKLFVGCPLSEGDERALKRSNPHLVSLLTQGGDYLEELKIDTVRYLGKFSTGALPLNALENLEANVESLIRRLLPNQPLAPPVLIAVP